MNQRILKNANGWIEIQRAEDDEIIYLFDPTGMIVSSHPSEPYAVTISKTPSNQDPSESIVIYTNQSDIEVCIGEDTFLVQSAAMAKEKIALLFSKGGASGEGLGYRELYGRIEWDGDNQLPRMVIEKNTLGFVPYYTTDTFLVMYLKENTGGGDSLHPSISDINKVHFYATKRFHQGREVIFDAGISKEENIIIFKTTEVLSIQASVTVNFDVEIPSSTNNVNQNISFPVDVNGNAQTVNTNINFDVTIPSSIQNVNKTINVPDRQMVDNTLTDGLCDPNDMFYDTKFRIVVLD